MQSKYSSKSHTKLDIGDLVVVRGKMEKPYFSPMGVVVDTEENNINETVAATIRKSNGENIRRHASDLVLLQKLASVPKTEEIVSTVPQSRTQREAARNCRSRNKLLLEMDAA